MRIPQGDVDNDKGVWKGAKMDNGSRTALMSCPQCWVVLSLSRHTIESDGTVKPSVSCFVRAGCFFHASVILEGWKP